MRKLQWAICILFGAVAVALGVSCIVALYWSFFHYMPESWGNFWVANVILAVFFGWMSWSLWLIKLSSD